MNGDVSLSLSKNEDKPDIVYKTNARPFVSGNLLESDYYWINL